MTDRQQGMQGPEGKRASLLPWWFRAAARAKGPAWVCGWLVVLVGILGRLSPLEADDAALNVMLIGWLLLMVSVVLETTVRTPRIAARPVGLPIRSRWMACNSPANRIPSHGANGFGSTFAIDLVPQPESAALRSGKPRAFHAPGDFFGFGQEIFAPVAGRVVAVSDGQRDHRSRSTDGAISYLKLESFVRSLGGPRPLAGNRIVLDLGGGAYALLAHLRRRSVEVRPGQQVRAGQLLAQCGNSGNSSEPHLHFQLMDHPRPLLAAGLPFVFTALADEAFAEQGFLPRNGEIAASAIPEARSAGSLARPFA